jgi:pilus assembly protein CpaD
MSATVISMKSRSGASGLSRALLAAAAVSLLSGCGSMKRDSVTVGAIPDDYRTNHPIVIGEKHEVIDLAVAVDGYRLTRSQKDSLEGFLAYYDKTAGAPVTILIPAGSANQAAAAAVSNEMAAVLYGSGVPHGYVRVQAYHAGQAASAPVRVTYSGVRASTGKCGRWTEDLTKNTENKHYTNFGCSYQNNLAAQIANPGDLLGPRRQTEIDAERRAIVIEDYQTAESDFSPETRY